MRNDKEDTMFVIEVEQPRPLSPIKTHDIMRVAKRIYRSKGIVLVSEVYHKCRTRIPGSVERYAASLGKYNRINASR